MTIEADIEACIVDVRTRIERSAQRVGRDPRSILLVAVSKKQPLERIQAYQRVCASRGEPVVLGENYVQEYRSKQPQLLTPVSCHLIGSLQRNKAAHAVELFDCIESVHSLDIAKAISTAAVKQQKNQSIYLQVNVSRDPAKSGFSREECKARLDEIDSLPGLEVSGLMTITWDYDRPEDARSDFAALRELREKLQRPGLKLSMGMSKDFDIAIEEGADVIRVGTALFGERA